MTPATDIALKTISAALRLRELCAKICWIPVIDPDRPYARPAREFTRQEAIDEAVRRVAFEGLVRRHQHRQPSGLYLAPLVRIEFRNIIRT